MLEARVAELLATHLSGFFEDVNPGQLQISLWSGNLVLNNVELRKDILESLSALLHGEHGSSDSDDTGLPPTSATAATREGSSGTQEDVSSKPALSMHMLMAPFTVVRGVIQQLVITIPWASLESEPVVVEAIGVKLVLGPLRARPFDAWEEQQREEAIKQRQLRRYEKARERLSRESAADTLGQGMPTFAPGNAACHSKRGETLSSASVDLVSGASWLSWLWDFDRMSQMVLRNATVTMRDICMCYEFDYEGLHPSCASAFCVFVKQMQLTTTNEKFEDNFVKNLLAPLCKRIVLSEVVLSVHAIPQGLGGAPGSVDSFEDTTTTVQPVSSTLDAGVTAYGAYALRWALSTKILQVKTAELQAKMAAPQCATGSASGEKARITSASYIDLTVTAVESIEVDWCFGVVQVLESMWRSYRQSLSCARYRKRLHLLRPIRGHATRHLDQGQVLGTASAGLSQHLPTAALPTARQRWSFALWCILDDIRRHRQAFSVHDRRRCEVVEAMVQFGHLRKDYTQYWKRTKGFVWAPPLNELETKKMELMERQLSLWQVIFLRCLSNAELLEEKDRYERQQALIEEARKTTKKGLLSFIQGADGGTSGSAAQSLWRWLFNSGTPVAKGAAESVTGTSYAPSTTHHSADVGVLCTHGCSPLCDLLALEWDLGRRYVMPHDSPLAQPRAPKNHLRKLADENKLFLTLHVNVGELFVRLTPIYWPLMHDSSVPATPCDTPLRRVEQQLVAQLHALELGYTTIPDDRADMASLSLLVGSALVTFEGVLRSVLLESKERFGEKCVMVRRNAQHTHMSVVVAPLLVVCQPTHEWAWWYAEMSAFARWARAVRQTFYKNATAEVLSCVKSAPAKWLRDHTHLTTPGDDHSTSRSSGASTPPPCQPFSAAGGRPLSLASVVPLAISVTIQSLDVCVPLFSHDLDRSALKILNHQPPPLSTTVLGESPSDERPQRSDSGRVMRSWCRFTEKASGDGAVGDGRPRQKDGFLNVTGMPLSEPFTTKDGIPSCTGNSKADGGEYTHPPPVSHSEGWGTFSSGTPERCFLNNEACLVLSVSTTQLLTVPPLTKGHSSAEKEYHLCIGDHHKAVRLFCQCGDKAPDFRANRQLEVFSFVAGEVRWNPKELTVRLNKGVDVVADPAVLALVNDALLKPTVFYAADADGERVRALTAELHDAECRWASKRRNASPWCFRTSTRVELWTNSDAAPGLRDVPPGRARDILWSVSTTSSSTPSSATRVAGASAGATLGINLFGGQVFVLGIGLARFFLRSGAEVDLAEVVCVAPEQLSPAAESYREGLGALRGEQPCAIELICRCGDSRLDFEERGTDEQLARCPLGNNAPPAFYLSIPDVAMTTTAGRKLVTIENITLVRTCATRTTPEVALTIQSVFALCDLVLVQVLEVLLVTLCSLRCKPFTSQVLAGASGGSEAIDSQVSKSSLCRFLPIRVRVQSLQFQLPMSNEDADTPYVEVTAKVEDAYCTVDQLDDDTARTGKHVHLQLTISEVVQLVDYIGGDPEVRYLVSACPWAPHTDGVGAKPLRCVADVIHRDPDIGGSDAPIQTRTSESPSITCRLTMEGGVFHVYCPFLYFYAAALNGDDRLVQLGDLARSALLVRGYTNMPAVTDCTQGARLGGSAGVLPGAATVLSLSLEASISDMDVLLATDAAVPIDLNKRQGFLTIHVDRVTCGLRRPPSASLSRSTPSDKRTRLFFETAGVQLLDLWHTRSQGVGLPNLTVSAEMGVLCVPKQDLTGYTYEYGTANDLSLMVEVHPASAIRPDCAAPLSEAASENPSSPSNVTIHMSLRQFQSLVMFGTRNVAQRCIPRARGSSMGRGCNFQHPLQDQPISAREKGACDCPPLTHHGTEAPLYREATRSSVMTLLFTIPRISVVVDVEGYANSEESACRSPTRRVSYELALRRGAQWYSATGGRWSASPVRNGQVSGLELVAREEELLECSPGNSDMSWRESSHLLLTIKLGALALLGEEERARRSSTAPGADVGNEGMTLRVTAALLCARLYVPHIKWWLQLIAMFLGAPSVEDDDHNSAARRPNPSRKSGRVASLSDGSQSGYESLSGQSSCPPFMPCEARRGEYIDEHKAPWSRRSGKCSSRPYAAPQLRGSVDISDTQVHILALGSGHGSHDPWCRLIVPKARLMLGPPSTPPESECEYPGDEERTVGELVFEIPSCPELQLWGSSEMAAGSAGLEHQRFLNPTYISILRQHPRQAPPMASEAPPLKGCSWRQATSATSASLQRPSGEAFFSARLLLFSDANGSPPLLFGRRYRATSLRLSRRSAVYVRLRGALLEIPAVSLFLLAREVLRQVGEVQPVVRGMWLPRGSLSNDRADVSPARTYVDVEAEVEDLELQLSAKHAPVDELQEGCGAGDDPRVWRIAIDAARLTTNVELRDVYTSTRHAATLISDEVGTCWRVRVWHLIHKLELRGLVLSLSSAAEARWALPDMRMTASLPLTNSIICMRPMGVKEEQKLSCLADDPQPQSAHKNKAFQVEPTAATMLKQLYCHVLTSFHVDLGLSDADAVIRAPGLKAPVQVCLPTLFALAYSAMRLSRLWCQTRPSSESGIAAAAKTHSTGTNASRWRDDGQRLRGSTTWYEFKFCFCGRRVELVTETPPPMIGDTATSEWNTHCVLCVTVVNAVTVHVERIVDEEKENPVPPLNEAQCDTGDADGEKERRAWCADDEWAEDAEVHTIVRLRTGPVHVHDSAENPILEVSTVGEGSMADVLEAAYAPYEAWLDISVNRVVVHASSSSAVALIGWCRACRTLAQRWASKAASMASPAALLPEKRSESGSTATGKGELRSSSLESILVQVQQTDLLFAPAARLSVREARMALFPVSKKVGSAAAMALELRCEEACVFSVLFHPTAGCDANSIVLARTSLPVLRISKDQQQSLSLQYRTPLVSIMNGDSHSWAMCAFRVAKVVRAAASALALDGAAAAAAALSPEPARGPMPSWMASISHAEINVAKAELLCFLSFSKQTRFATPVVSFVVREAVLSYVDSASVMHPSDAHAMVAKKLTISGVLTVTYSTIELTDGEARPLLDDVRMTAALSLPSQPPPGLVEVVLGAEGATEHNAVFIYVPTGDTLTNVVTALWLVAGQRVPRRYTQPRTPQKTPFSGDDADSGTGTQWHVVASLDSLHVRCILSGEANCSRAPTLRHPWSMCVCGVYSEYRTHCGSDKGSAGRPYVEISVTSVVGTTVITNDADVLDKQLMQIPAVFVAVRPLVEPSSEGLSVEATATVRPNRTHHPRNSGFFLRQQSFSLSLGEEECREGMPHTPSDDAHALVVRLHTLHAHPSMALLRMFTNLLWRPCVRGISAASADTSAADLLSALEHTVLRVGPAAAIPPAFSALNRRDGRVHVIEVMQDWHLHSDLRLGGEGGFQLHFRNTAGRSVITVRCGFAGAGDGKCQAGATTTLFLTLPVNANGEVCPAIRVDPDLTVRFEGVRVIVAEEVHFSGIDGGAAEAYVELGERSLCLLPPPAVTPIDLPARGIAPRAQSKEPVSNVSPTSPGDTPEKSSDPRPLTLAPFAASRVFSITITIGFDISLSDCASRIAATGAAHARYRFEEKRSSERTLRSEHDGECTVSLDTCLCERGPLTVTPMSATAQLSYAANENLFRVVLNCGSTLWQLPVRHAYLLMEIVGLAHLSLKELDLSPPVPRPWWPPDTGTAHQHSSAQRATFLDARVEVSSWALTLTDDSGEALAVLLLDHVRLHCTTDIDGSDVALSAEGTVSLRDCIGVDAESGLCQGGTACNAAMAPSVASTSAARVLFSAHPHLSLSFAQLPHSSRSLSISVYVADVVATLPLVTVARLWRTAAPQVGIGTRFFLNDSGIEVEVAEAVSKDTASQSVSSRWRLAAVPGRLIRTNIPVSSAGLVLSPVLSPVDGTASTATQKRDESCGGSAFVNVAALNGAAVCRVTLPGYTSTLGALDLVVRKSVCDKLEAVHLTTSVLLANVFFAGATKGNGISPAEAGVVSVTADCIRLVVPPRSARYVPLPLLQTPLAVELDGCAYQPAAKMLTWSIMADAMAALADHSVSGGPESGSATAGFMVYSSSVLHKSEDVESENGHGVELRAPALSGCVRALDASTITFPMLLSSSMATLETSLCDQSIGAQDKSTGLGAPTSTPSRISVPHLENEASTTRVVQLTWRRHFSPETAQLFTGRFPTCEYTVAVEPVWTLWNRTGCRLRLQLRTSGDGLPRQPVETPQSTTSLPSDNTRGSVVAAAEVENGACFQWTPTALDVLKGTVLAFVELMAPSLVSDTDTVVNLRGPAQWWWVAEPLFLQEPPPSYMRLHQGGGVARGAVRIEAHGASIVVMRCAGLLRSALATPVYVRDPAQHRALLGFGVDGRLMPGQQVPLFYPECVTKPAPHAGRVGFTVSASPVRSVGDRAGSVQETEAYYLTTPVVATVLSAAKNADCAHFYTVSAVSYEGFEQPAKQQGMPAPALACMWTPKALTVVQLGSLCRIRNTNLHRTLLAMPFDASTRSDVEGVSPTWSTVTLIPPGEEREVTEFCPYAEEPEVQFSYTAGGGQAPAHAWSPPVRLLSLATSIQPVVLKHICISRSVHGEEADAQPNEPCFTMTPMYCGAGDTIASKVTHSRCLTVQSSTESGVLTVSVGLQALPPFKLVNRLNVTLEFFQCALTRDSDLASSTRHGTVSTALCTRTARPCSYMVAAESTSYGCWEVPTLEAPALRIILHSKIRKGSTVSHDVDLLRWASSPASGVRVGNTDAYIYVSLNHQSRQYTVTVAPSRRLGCRMLVQPRRLTQMEMYVRSCTVYVASITLPRAGPFARKSLIAHGMRGRMRLGRSARSPGSATCDTVPRDATHDDMLIFLKHQELDIVLVRLLGFYGTVTFTERHLIGSASLALLEAVNCTTVEAVHPVLLRVGPRASSGSSSTLEGRVEVEPLISSPMMPPGGTPEGMATETQSANVSHFKDPSWFAVEVQLMFPEHAAHADGVVVLPVTQLQVTVPPVVLRADDDFLFTMRTTAVRLGEEWASAVLDHRGRYAANSQDDLGSTRRAVITNSMTHSARCVYSFFVHVLRISPVEAEVTYTRCGHRQYNPFKDLSPIPEQLIPSVDGLPVSLKGVRLLEVELQSCDSLFVVAKSLLWPLYRTQLLLQSYKVFGSLDVLGNPRALLGNWSRGVWSLVTNSSDQSRWVRTREFFRTTTSSALHSVGVLARSIGNLSGAPPWEISSGGLRSGSSSVGNEDVMPVIPQPRGVLGEVIHEVGGGISDAVTKPILGARDKGAPGFFSGLAAGLVSLAGRPVFGFFRGISVTSEFYAQLLGGLGELTKHEARQLGLGRNYRLVSTSVNRTSVSENAGSVAHPVGGSTSTAPLELELSLSRESLPRAPTILSHRLFERCLSDIPRWRRGNESNLRLAVERVGLHSMALHAPYTVLCAFLSPSELRAAMPYVLTGVLMGTLMNSLTHNGAGVNFQANSHSNKHQGRVCGGSGTGEGRLTRAELERQCERALHIKASLGLHALHLYVTDEVFMRVCSLAEMEACWTEQEEQEIYSVVLAKTMSAAAKQLLLP
ncbi:hypothetical protein JKF63_00134 [Porcisia hertigi]|uniref:N-terminal region of Chorein, a TM vesicle-mediated sorter family protein n=1 Tax=Porcisia hertigi TaxID=2761500 RepID=A0A836I7R4_9TRYP|nr:hypothetical protein JKF63_00134 [Porcisia hertigi]